MQPFNKGIYSPIYVCIINICSKAANGTSNLNRYNFKHFILLHLVKAWNVRVKYIIQHTVRCHPLRFSNLPTDLRVEYKSQLFITANSAVITSPLFSRFPAFPSRKHWVQSFYEFNGILQIWMKHSHTDHFENLFSVEKSKNHLNIFKSCIDLQN